MEMKIKIINWCLSVLMIKSNWKNIEPFGLRLKIKKIWIKYFTSLWWSIKTKIRTHGNRVYSNFCGLNVPEDDIKCECFTVISIDSLLAYQKNLDNCAYKIGKKQMKGYLVETFFKD